MQKPMRVKWNTVCVTSRIKRFLIFSFRSTLRSYYKRIADLRSYFFDNKLAITNNLEGYMKTVEFENVVKIYGKGEGKQVAVDHVSFTIEKGNL